MKIPGRRSLHNNVRRIQKRFSPSKGLILMYHRIAEVPIDPWALCVTPQQFSQQMEVLKKNFHPLTLEQLVQTQKAGKIPPRAVVVTFDDGYADNLHQAKPILEHYNIPATIFVSTGYLDKAHGFWWDTLEEFLLQPCKLPEELTLTINQHNYHWQLEHAADYSQQQYQADRFTKAQEADPGTRMAFYYEVWQRLLPLSEQQRQPILRQILDWSGSHHQTQPERRSLYSEEVVQLAQGDLIEIGAHTITHPFLSSQSVDKQKYEIEKSKADLEQLIHQSIDSFSYPFGNRTADTIQLTQIAGFQWACSTVQDLVWHQSDCFQLPRFGVENWSQDSFTKNLLNWFHG